MHPFANFVVSPDSVGIHWFGQSSFALKGPDGLTIQIDPYFPSERPNDEFVHAEAPLDESELPTDWVILTHNHGDHTCVESIKRIHGSFPDARYVGPAESMQEIENAGIDGSRTTTVVAGDRCPVGTATLHVVWSKSPQGIPADRIKPPNVQHLGFVIEIGGVRVYVSGDPINTFAEHRELLDPIRALRPDIGLLTCHPTEGEFPYFEGSARMAVELGLKTAVPVHYDCFIKRTYDPSEWAALLPPDGPRPLIIGYNQSVLCTP